MQVIYVFAKLRIFGMFFYFLKLIIVALVVMIRNTFSAK